MVNINEVESMTPYEYELRMFACQLRRLDQEFNAHMQAWTTRQIKATKGKRQEPYYKDFKQFFDYEKREKELLGLSLIDERIDDTTIDLLRNVNK
ncbi:hypothetical protein UAY_01776 [Enterococcus moraviensis ATCC BAA-383]|uniref:Uncharacterized protein n=2 Tax=Enterococcus moraviensis TaxID=155617 RepID=R2SZP8_9ENTE|nr:hypothetical protein UAY_01776 [Enterococcus moraviensis ATCC BAA-383]EOT73098.1 hypothetical protein I586_00091 [Enterococcus moraviensis ATCC BAA-383]OJG68656.1 hypothetical protein RV09_GL000055 [Enterococcus moraviensis]